MQKNNDDLGEKILKLENRVAALEKILEKNSMLKSHNNHPSDTEDVHTSTKVIQGSITKSPYQPKAYQTGVKIVEGVVTESLKILTKHGEVEVDENLIINNALVLGDEVILEYKSNALDKFKVARRAKRYTVEALVTVKDTVYYGVSKFGVHKLINLDVQKKQVLKGFEVLLFMPKDNETKVKVALIASVESSGTSSNPDSQEAVSTELNGTNQRVVEEDDLV